METVLFFLVFFPLCTINPLYTIINYRPFFLSVLFQFRLREKLKAKLQNKTLSVQKQNAKCSKTLAFKTKP